MFENPYFVLIIPVAALLVLTFLAVFFIRKTMQVSQGKEMPSDLNTLVQVKALYDRLKETRSPRCVTYIRVSLENLASLYSEEKAALIHARLFPVLSAIFLGQENCRSALMDRQNFAVVSGWTEEEAQSIIESHLGRINQMLTQLEVRGMVEVHFGTYCSFATAVSFEEALNRAKQACSLADGGNSPYVKWSMDHGRELKEKLEIENQIENEIENNRFFLEYQPVVEAASGKILGCEVLSRLNSDEKGIVMPRKFLPAVSSVGINDKFDYYIFEKNCKWVSNNKNRRGSYFYSVNFSRSTLCDPQFPDLFSQILSRYGLSAQNASVEILEDMELSEVEKEQLKKNIAILKKQGICVLLDDFGSGFTTFEDLQNFSIDVLKLDRSILQNAHTPTGGALLRNMIKTAKDLGLKVVCEGVETAKQRELALSCGADMLQGYYFSRPVSVTRLEEFFRGDVCLPAGK